LSPASSGKHQTDRSPCLSRGHRKAGTSAEPPSFSGLRSRWNRAKATECVDRRKTGEVWWPQISKEAFANGIKDAVDAS